MSNGMNTNDNTSAPQSDAAAVVGDPSIPGPEADSGGTLLYLEGVNVSFDGFKAIDDLNFYVDDGELRCVIGPNGAGKTTMMDIVTGKTRPDSGTVWFGQSINLTKMSEPEVAQAGIGRMFQKPTVFEVLTVSENLEISAQGNRSPWSMLRNPLSSEQRDRVENIATVIALQDHLAADASQLSHGQKQWLEIGMLLMQNPRLLLVDEPVAGMTHQEMDRTGELLAGLAGQHTVVVVEHDMDFVRSLNSKVTVLHQGHVLAEGMMAEVQANPDVVKVYLGE